MSSSDQDHSRHRVFVYGLNRWRQAGLTGVLVLLTLAGLVCAYQLLLDYALQPWLQHYNEHWLLTRQQAISEEIQHEYAQNPNWDSVTYLNQTAQSQALQLEWLTLPDVTATPANTSERLAITLLSADQRWLPVPGQPYQFRLSRQQWPWYRRAETLSLLVLFVLAAVLGWVLRLCWGKWRVRQANNTRPDLMVATQPPGTTREPDAHSSDDAAASALANLRESLQVTAHEIRRPLQRLVLVQEQVAPLLKTHYPEAQHVMSLALEEITEVVDEALWYARYSYGVPMLQRQLVDLNQLICELVAQQRILHPMIEYRIISTAVIAFAADRKLVKRALVNVLHNAVKYGASQIELGWRVDTQGLTITVADDGPGIPLAQRGLMFEPFVSVAQSAQERPCGGLGLAIVQSICRSHGGQARLVDSDLGGVAVVLHFT